MTRRRKLRRRLLWAGVLLGLVVVVAVLSVVNAGLWLHDQVRSAARDRRTKRTATTTFRTAALAVLTPLVALVLVAPASADRWAADGPIGDRALAAAPTPDWFERYVAAHSVREPVVDDRFTIDPTAATVSAATDRGGDIGWPQIGLGLGLGAALVLALLFAARPAHVRRPATR